MNYLSLENKKLIRFNQKEIENIKVSFLFNVYLI